MRYPASEKAEIIELVEQSHLPAKRALDKLGIPRATFYRWYDRYCEGGIEALADHRSRPDRVWNRISDEVRGQIVDLALVYKRDEVTNGSLSTSNGVIGGVNKGTYDEIGLFGQLRW